MELRKLFLCAGFLALLMICTPFAFAEDTIRDQVRCNTTWDESYLYIACKVDCPDAQATHNKPNVSILGDDSIEVFFETDNQHSSKISTSCYAMAVSVAGGCEFRAGDQAGALALTPAFTYKYGSTVQGTLNNPDDVDMSYTVEMAIPWQLLKVKTPIMGDMMSFNLLIRKHGEKGGFISLAPQVKTDQDVLDPSKWANIVFAAQAFGAATVNLEKIVSPRYVVRPPLVDGIRGDREYSRNSLFTMDLPMPAGGYEAKFPTQQLVFAKYAYHYQLDMRKESPVSSTDNGVNFENFPARNAGPWMSYDRVQWHKDELTDMAAAGIDVLLPVYSGSKVGRAAYSAKGLDCLVSALEELQSEAKPHPMVAMFFDASSIAEAYGIEKPDMKSEETRRTIYGMIKDFYDRVPPELRAFAQASKPNAGQVGCIAFVGPESATSNFDSALIGYCNDRFQKDFGCPLIWKMESIAYGLPIYGDGPGSNETDANKIRVRSVAPCYMSKLGAENIVTSRLDGETYQKAWEKILGENPHWVVCDSWNNFEDGREICASRQYGRKYIDITRANVTRFHGGRDYHSQFTWINSPKMISQKQFSLAEVTILNSGQVPWKASDRYEIGYRWYKSGRFYGESKVRRPIDKDVMPGESITVDIGLAAMTAVGTEMPEGPCEVRFELIRMSDGKLFSSFGDQPLVVPIVIGQPKDWNATYISSNVPAMLASNQSYPVTVRVRNDGAQMWIRGTTRLTCKLYKVSNYVHDAANDSAEEVPIQKVEGILVKDCKPGEIAAFSLRLSLASADKKLLQSWKQDDPWSYQLRFDINNGDAQLSSLGVRTLNRIVDIFDADFGPRIIDSDLPNKLAAGQSVEAKVVIKNAGAQPWDRKRIKIGYHWYHLDGTQMQWDNPTTPISANLQPGWPTVVRAAVTAPEYDGQYVLVWDVMVDDKWLSTQPLSRGGETLPMFVEVTNGRLSFVDLSKQFDICATSSEAECAIGNFDGQGCSLPAELMPPDIGVMQLVSHLYPVGYQCDRAAHPDGRISFFYPDNNSGAKNAVACNLQAVDVDPGKYAAAYILAACSGPDNSADMGLSYAEAPILGDKAAELVKFSTCDWSAVPSTYPEGVTLAYAAKHRHTSKGEDPGKSCYLYSTRIPLKADWTLTGLLLPKNPDIKIVAITLERSAIPAPPAPTTEAKAAK